MNKRAKYRERIRAGQTTRSLNMITPHFFVEYGSAVSALLAHGGIPLTLAQRIANGITF